MLSKRVSLVFYKIFYWNAESRKIIMFEVVIFVIIKCLKEIINMEIIVTLVN